MARRVLPVRLAIQGGCADHRAMRLIIQCPDGSLRPTIIIAMIGTRMRASVPGCDDALEFRLDDGRWLAENGEVVEMQFEVADHKFQALVQDTATACDDQSDKLEVYLWAACVPLLPSLVRVN